MKLGIPGQRLIIALVALLVLLGVGVQNSQAATPGGNGLRVTPVRDDLTIKPGETYTHHVSVTNVTSATATLQAVVSDFIANPNESGQPSILLNPNDFAPRHSLKRYVQPIESFTLRPGEQKSIPVVIKIPSDGAGGGYFGVVRFGPATENPTGPNENVSLSGNVGSLILVKVPGDVVEKLTIASFDARVNDRPSSFFTSNKGISATVRFQNSGNIQVEPFGAILLKDRKGKVLGHYEVNNTEPRGSVLPDSIRKMPVSITKVGSFGQFKLEGNFGYGSNGQLLSASTTFYVIPLWMIIGFFALVVLILFLVFGLPRLIRAYNQRILRRAGRR